MHNSIVDIHSRLLEMAKATAGILEANNIPYMLAYGTLLGAIRHQGFIPWDEDFDLWLFDDSYDSAVELLRAELPEHLFLEDAKSEPKYYHAWARIKDLKSIVSVSATPQDNAYSHKGLSLDLYRLKKVRMSQLKNYLNDENRAYIARRKRLGLIDDEDYQNRLAKLAEDERQAVEHPVTDQREIYALVLYYPCKKLEIADVFPLIKYAFEDTEFFGPANADNILTDIYGDYMTLPPIEKRKKSYSSVVFLD